MAAVVKATLARMTSDSFLLTWNVSSAVTFLFPLLAFSVARLTSEQDYNQNENNEENYYDDSYQNPENYDEYGNYVGPTPWWKFWKSSNNGQYEEEGSNDERMAPWWYIWGEREGRDREEESGAVIFAYLWTLLFFAGLAYLVNTTKKTIGPVESLRVAIFGFANYCFVIIILLVGLEDAIETEGREVEEDGFYGQSSVLLLVTVFFAMVQAIAFVFWTSKRIKNLKAAALIETQSEYVNVDFEANQNTSNNNDKLAA